MDSREEFANVQFERSDDERSSGLADDDDDLESVWSDMEPIVDYFPDDEIKPSPVREGEDNAAFGIDAIKYAVYAKWEHEDGRTDWGWRYNVMWTGYLQTGYDSSVDSIEETDNPEEDLVRSFWKSYDTSLKPFLRKRNGAREPPPPPKKSIDKEERFECPPLLMRKWLADTDGQRLYKTYLARRQWQRKLDEDQHRVPKRLSDHYVWKKEQRRKKSEDKKAKAAGPSNQASGSGAAGASGGEAAAKIWSREPTKEKSKSRSASKESTPKPPQNAVDTAADERKSRYKQGAPGERSASKAGSSKTSPVPASNQLSEVARGKRPVSPGDEGLSDFNSDNSLFGSDTEADKPIASKASSPTKKRKLNKEGSSSTGSEEKKKKKEKSRSKSYTPVPLPPVPAVPVKRLEKFEKIKKRTADDPPFDLTGRAHIRAPTPSFGEPVLGIFDPASPTVPTHPAPSATILPPKPLAPASALPRRPDPPAVPAQPPSMLDTVLAGLRAQQAANQAKQAAARLPTPPPTGIVAVDPRPRPPSREPSTSAATSPMGPPTALPQIEELAPRAMSPSAEPPSTLPTPTETKSSMASRPKYQQPVKMKFIDEGTAAAPRSLLPAGRKTSATDMAGPSQLPMRSPRDVVNSPLGPLTLRSPMDPRSMMSPRDPRQSPLNGGQTPIRPSAEYEGHSAPPQVARHPPPVQPKSFGQAVAGPSGYASRGAGPLPDQKQSYHTTIPPKGPKLMQNNPPSAPASSATFTNATSPHASGAPARTFVPRNLANVPIGQATPITTTYDPASEPRRALISPPLTQSAQLSPIVPPQYNPSADPRRRAGGSNMPTPSEASSTPNAYNTMSPRSPGPDTRRLPTPSAPAAPTRPEPICDFRAYIPFGSGTADFAVKAVRGDAARGPDFVSHFLGSSNSTKVPVALEEIDGVNVQGTLKLGARLVQWAKLSHIDEKTSHGAKKGDWEVLKTKVGKDRKAYVTYTDYLPIPEDPGVSAHYAIIIASPNLFDLSRDSSKGMLGLGKWTLSEIKIGVFIVSLPLSSIPAPQLPNPVRPHFEPDADSKPPIPPYKIPLMDSFGLDSSFMRTLQNRMVMKYPGDEGPTDSLHKEVINALKFHGAKAAGNDPAEIMLLLNQKWSKSLKSTSVRQTLSRRTAYYAFGPDLRLYPSQWALTKIWQGGGLVTFSPTFILRSPAKFLDIMSMIQAVNTWGAYVMPSVVEWCHQSWSEPARCPDPTKAFDALSRSLFLDQHLLRLSGSASAAGGGLAVSCAPPSVHQNEACHRWMSWLKKVHEQKDYDALVDLCVGVTPREFARRDSQGENDVKEVKNGEGSSSTRNELELVDIERDQMEDLIAMRSRPHLMPYRRYIYIGEVSLDKTTRQQYGQQMEFVAADDFAAIFSGAL